MCRKYVRSQSRQRRTVKWFIILKYSSRHLRVTKRYNRFSAWIQWERQYRKVSECFHQRLTVAGQVVEVLLIESKNSSAPFFMSWWKQAMCYHTEIQYGTTIPCWEAFFKKNCTEDVFPTRFSSEGNGRPTNFPILPRANTGSRGGTSRTAHAAHRT